MASTARLENGRPDVQSPMRRALVVISVSSLVAALLVLVACVFLLVAVLHLDADIQNLGNGPAQTGLPTLIP